MRDIAGVAVEEQHGGTRICRGHPPCLQGFAVTGANLDLVELKSIGLRRGCNLAPDFRVINEPGLKQEHERQHRPVGDRDRDQDFAQHAWHGRYQRIVASFTNTVSVST